MRTGITEEVRPFQGVIHEIWKRRWYPTKHTRTSRGREVTVYEADGYPISERTKRDLVARQVAARLSGIDTSYSCVMKTPVNHYQLSSKTVRAFRKLQVIKNFSLAPPPP